MSWPRTLPLVAYLLGLGCALTAGAPEASPIVREAFDRPSLDPAWHVDASAGNTVQVTQGVLEIKAAENTYAHIERKLGVDHVRATCAIKPGAGVSWCTSIFLYWKGGDWCQMGIIPRKAGRYYACWTTGGQRGELDLARCRFDQWQYVGLELGADCVRFLSSPDGRSWRTEHFVARPASFRGPPALLIVGKGFGLDEGTPDLDADYGERGPVAASMVKDVLVVPTEPARMTITAEEREQKELAGQDPLGAQILKGQDDPTFEAVAALLPPLLKPREAVGVKDHPFEIGIDDDGTIQPAAPGDGWEQRGPFAFLEVGAPPVALGSAGCRKQLIEGYLPVVIAQFKHDGLTYHQTVFGHSQGMSPDAPLWAFVGLAITKTTTGEPQQTRVTLRYRPEIESRKPIVHDVNVPTGGEVSFCFRMPAPLGDRTALAIEGAEFIERLKEVESYWSSTLNSGMQVAVPEGRVNNAWRAWLAYNFLDVDKVGDGFHPHDGSGFYEAVYGYSAALYCHALDLWGFHDDARRYLDSLSAMVKPDGLFFEHYGLPDQGALLMALSEHFRMTGEAAWLRGVAPTMVRMCDWIIRQRRESMKTDAGKKPVTYGLIRFTPYADFQTKTFDYYGDAYSCVGLEHTADVLRQIDMAADADRLAQEAAAYRQDILASMDAAVFELDGLRILPMEPDTHRLVRDSGNTGGDYYGLIASMMLESQFLPADDPRAALVTNFMERRNGLILGMCEFDEGVDHAYTYGYWMNCLGRDEVRRVLLGFYGTLAYGMGRETYCGVEVTQLITGEPTPTMPHLYSGTQQLRLLRMMLLREQGDSLLIGQAIPRHWLEAGRRVDVRRAPTRFGQVSFTIESHADQGRIRAWLAPPTARPPASIQLRVRHPAHQPIKAVKVDGQAVDSFTADTITLKPYARPVAIEVEY